MRVPLLECPQEVPEGVRSVMIQESGHVKGWYRSGCRWVLEEAEEEEDEECKTQHCCNSQGVNGLQQHGEVRRDWEPLCLPLFSNGEEREKGESMGKEKGCCRV